MRGRRRDRDKASNQEKQDSPVEVEPLSSDRGGDGGRSELTNSTDVGEPETPTVPATGSESEPAWVAPAESGAVAPTEPAAVAPAEPAAVRPTDPEPQPTEPQTDPTPSPAASVTPARAETHSGARAQATTAAPAQAPTEATSTAPAEATFAPPTPTVVVETAGAVGTNREAPLQQTHEGAAPGEEPQSASHLPLPRIIAVANQKGGVGKTTTSVNLGAALAELGFRVLVVDLDPQGNATTGLGVDARNFERSMYDVIMRDDPLEDCIEPTNMKNLFVAPATIDLAGAEIELVPAFSRELKLKRAIETVIDDFDYVLIDCPPSLGLITVNGLAAAAEVLVPIQCEYYALEGLSQLLRNVHLVASNLNDGLDVSTIVLTMYDARTKLSDQVASEVREHFGAKVCRNVIPRTVRLSEAPSFGQPISVFDPTSRGAIAYRELAKEVSGGAS